MVKLSYKVFILALIFIVLPIMSACGEMSAVVTNIPLPTSTLISTPTESPTIELTPTEWLPFYPNIMNDGECSELVPTSIPVKGTENFTEEEIAEKLFAIYLEKHISLPPHHFCKLENYRIEETSSDERIDFLAKEQEVDFVNWVVYSVKISEIPSSWVAANGEFAPGGWIIRKSLIIGITNVNDEYVLQLIGTGP